MPTPRTSLVSSNDTPYHHCISRCVRRAFLCGRDPVNGYDFEHRRQWIVDRIQLLSSVFAIDLCAYAVKSNHFHVVVRINAEETTDWSDEEVVRRWTQLFSTPDLVHRLLGHSILSTLEQDQVAHLIATWRARLQDLSWFMRCLNEPIARLANHQEHCTGPNEDIHQY